uniref:Uncharacterized protein n=1 Tax=Anguilla anguilla TaxID=7936 RepID=A0A0E9R0Y2_ANGAN
MESVSLLIKWNVPFFRFHVRFTQLFKMIFSQ